MYPGILEDRWSHIYETYQSDNTMKYLILKFLGVKNEEVVFPKKIASNPQKLQIVKSLESKTSTKYHPVWEKKSLEFDKLRWENFSIPSRTSKSLSQKMEVHIFPEELSAIVKSLSSRKNFVESKTWQKYYPLWEKKWICIFRENTQKWKLSSA